MGLRLWSQGEAGHTNITKYTDTIWTQLYKVTNLFYNDEASNA